MIKFGVVLPTWCYNTSRVGLIYQTFGALDKTRNEDLDDDPSLLLIVKGDRPSLISEFMENQRSFNSVTVLPQDGLGCDGTEQTLAFGAQWFFDNDQDITHVIWMGDDAKFNPSWLYQLQELIYRHEDAVSWSVYRSAHVAYHAPLLVDPKTGDVAVKSICGHGMTFSRQEWKAWGVNWQEGQAWPNPYSGNTLDLHHAWKRQGERWVTPKSYIEHTGRTGLHCTPNVPEYAIDFVEND